LGLSAALVLLGAFLAAYGPIGAQGPKRIVLLAGRPSHPPGMHEFRAGCLILQKSLSAVRDVTVEVIPQGWPTRVVDGRTVDDNARLDGAAAILVYADGGRGNPAIQNDRIAVLDALAARGTGLGFAHYGVEVPVGPGADAFVRWIGGFYEDRFSVNPMWTPAMEVRPNHPITRGVMPFSNTDEWYFNLRWPAATERSRITPILRAKPSDDVRDGPYVNPRGPYPHVVAGIGQTETLMWAYERPNGGRGFGFTGGHTHAHWGDANQRRIVANALLWIAKVEVPPGGIVDGVTASDLTANLDDKR
jgi:hypothetical protein